MAFLGRISGTPDIAKFVGQGGVMAEHKIVFSLMSKDDYVLTILQSKKETIVLTVDGMFTVNGGAMGVKKSINFLPWSTIRISNVAWETAGTFDMDFELKFDVNGQRESIDIAKSQVTDAAILFRAFVELDALQRLTEIQRSALDAVKSTMAVGRGIDSVDSVGELPGKLHIAFDRLTRATVYPTINHTKSAAALKSSYETKTQHGG